MRLLVAGRAHEIRGFTLAGVETVRCDTRAQAKTIVDGLGADIGLLIVSRWFQQAAGEHLAKIRDRSGRPIVLTLPEEREGESERR
jgi:vacuolar-type H+-ATPase subunit F/Vma7